MIQFALLFGLGFLTAVLLVCLLAPAIHRRIVWFTEKRLRATTPLSAQEVRAQKDMVRALYAAENSRTEQALSREREKSIGLQLQQETLKGEAGRLTLENDRLHGQIDDMSVEAGDLRSRLRREEGNLSQLKSSLRISEQAHVEKESELDGLRKRIDRMAVDADNLKIDVATRETEVESLRFRYNGLRTERDKLRAEIEAMTQRARDAEMRLGQEEQKVARLEEKLNREISANADRQEMIDRRAEEVSRLKETLKTANSDTRETARSNRKTPATKTSTAKSSGVVKAAARPKASADGATVTEATAEMPRDVGAEIALLSEEARNRSAAVADRLQKARAGRQDAALREEIATIAANMVALTALQEGGNSPIHALLNDAESANERKSLADRAAELLDNPPA